MPEQTDTQLRNAEAFVSLPPSLPLGAGDRAGSTPYPALVRERDSRLGTTRASLLLFWRPPSNFNSAAARRETSSEGLTLADASRPLVKGTPPAIDSRTLLTRLLAPRLHHV
jgi:hypothetical protein